MENNEGFSERHEDFYGRIAENNTEESSRQSDS